MGGMKMKFYFKENTVHTEFEYGELVISGNEEYGFRPFQLMVSSIVSCSGSVFKQILSKQRIEIESLEISADVKRNADEANRIEQIDLTFIVKGSELNQAKLDKSLAIARKNCAMVQIGRASCRGRGERAV